MLDRLWRRLNSVPTWMLYVTVFAAIVVLLIACVNLVVLYLTDGKYIIITTVIVAALFLAEIFLTYILFFYPFPQPEPDPYELPELNEKAAHHTYSEHDFERRLRLTTHLPPHIADPLIEACTLTFINIFHKRKTIRYDWSTPFPTDPTAYLEACREAIQSVHDFVEPYLHLTGTFTVPLRQTISEQELTKFYQKVAAPFRTEAVHDCFRIGDYNDNSLLTIHHSDDDRYIYDEKETHRWHNEVRKSLGEEGYTQWSAMARTPFYESIVLDQITSIPVPYAIPEAIRFEHQWLTGATGTGKTTILSNFIADDLDRVARGECSILVMDSQNELVPNIARLARFGPNGDLYGKLIYIEANEEHPPALNILDSASGAEDMVTFFLRSGLQSDTSGHMDIVLSYLIPATLTIPNATVFTILDLLSKGGYEKYQSYFALLDEEVQTWLRERLTNPGPLKITFDALRTRLDGFAASALFRRMFRHPVSKLNLYEELRTPKVVLINSAGAALNPALLEAFGRFFLAQLLQAATKRMYSQERLPTFFYIDEAADYIGDEARVATIIDRARKQNVGLILAQQHESAIHNSHVLAAVRRAAIQMAAICRGTASLSLRGAPPVTVNVPDCNFANEPRMTEAEWQLTLASMRAQYTASAIPRTPSTPNEPAQEW